MSDRKELRNKHVEFFYDFEDKLERTPSNIKSLDEIKEAGSYEYQGVEIFIDDSKLIVRCNFTLPIKSAVGHVFSAINDNWTLYERIDGVNHYCHINTGKLNENIKDEQFRSQDRKGEIHKTLAQGGLILVIQKRTSEKINKDTRNTWVTNKDVVYLRLVVYSNSTFEQYLSSLKADIESFTDLRVDIKYLF